MTGKGDMGYFLNTALVDFLTQNKILVLYSICLIEKKKMFPGPLLD